MFASLMWTMPNVVVVLFTGRHGGAVRRADGEGSVDHGRFCRHCGADPRGRARAEAGAGRHGVRGQPAPPAVQPGGGASTVHSTQES